MKVAFIGGSISAREVTKYVSAFALYWVMQKKGSLSLMQTIFRSDTKRFSEVFGTVKHDKKAEEDLNRYYIGGMQYLIEKNEIGELTRRELKMAEQTVIPGELTCLSTEERTRIPLPKEGVEETFKKIMQLSEEDSGMVFIDAGIECEENIRLCKEVDLVIVLLSQDERLLNEYFSRRQTYEKVAYFFCDYNDAAALNQRNLQRIYRMSEGTILPISYHPNLNEAYESGNLKRFLEHRKYIQISDLDYTFIQSLKLTVSRVEKLLCG